MILGLAASVKRSHESWVSGNGGFGSEDRRASTSPAASRSFEAASPSSSNVSVRRKTVCIFFSFCFLNGFFSVSIFGLHLKGGGFFFLLFAETKWTQDSASKSVEMFY